MITYLFNIFFLLKTLLQLKSHENVYSNHILTCTLPSTWTFWSFSNIYKWRLSAICNYVINIRTKLFSNLKGIQKFNKYIIKYVTLIYSNMKYMCAVVYIINVSWETRNILRQRERIHATAQLPSKVTIHKKLNISK
jgi:hypothetical protein